MARAFVPYENQIIGAFIFAMGHSAAKRLGGTLATLNLLQQTPMDPTFGDFISGFELCVAIEFKRTKAEFPTEVDRWHPEGIRQFLAREDLLAVAHHAHLVGYFDCDRENIFTSPYTSIFCTTDDALTVDARHFIDEICGGTGRGVKTGG